MREPVDGEIILKRVRRNKLWSCERDYFGEEQYPEAGCFEHCYKHSFSIKDGNLFFSDI